MNVMTNPAALDVERIRQDFPILAQTIRGKKLVFLDSAASAQKPRVVIDAMSHAMETQYANVHRGLHWMSERQQNEDETASQNQIVFTTGSQIAQLNAANTTTLVVGEVEGMRYSFNRYGFFMPQAGLWHYSGDAVQPAEASDRITLPAAG